MTYQQLLRRYMKKHKELVEPNQGWGSLNRGLWLAYSMGRVRKYTDLGTYVDKPLDHGVGPPANAFDLGRKNRFFNKGWNYIHARLFARMLWRHHMALNIDYIILGTKIISRKHPTWRKRPKDSHQFHIHVSGIFR